MTAGRRRWVAPAVVTTLFIATAAVAISSANPDIVGVYHDDAIYLASARSIAFDGSYRLIHLPPAPFATKYPPLYPLLLAAVWKLAPDFPANIVLFKAINGVLIGLIGVLTYAWAGRVGEMGGRQRILLSIVVCFSPGTMYFADVVLSDPLFVVLLLGLFIVQADDGRTPSTRDDVLAGVFAGLACLTRWIGVAASLGLIWHVFVRRGARRAASVALPALALPAAWLLWRAWAQSGQSELLTFYVEYEASIWQSVFTAPMLAARMLSTNALFLLSNTPAVFGWPLWIFIALAAVLLGAAAMLTGCWRSLALPLRILTIYFVSAIGHPPLARYLMPFVPVVYLGMALGAISLLRHTSKRHLAYLALLPFIAVDAAWFYHFRQVTGRALHLELGRSLTVEWEGYRDTADWLATHTPPDAVLGACSDPLYFLFAGRKGVRPWPYRPQYYFPMYRIPMVIPDPAWLSSELDRLGVTHLVVDPLAPDGEGAFARATIDALLAGPLQRWTLVFRSRNDCHRVYQRPAHAPGIVGPAPPQLRSIR